ncbi:MAG: diguanylate cyclase domain-containing protein [Acidobacteriota bacterium]
MYLESVLAKPRTDKVFQMKKDVLDRISHPMVIVCPKGDIVACNLAFTQLTGFVLDDLNGTKWDELTVPSGRIKENEAFKNAVGQRKRQCYQKLSNLKGGAQISIQAIVDPIFDEEGRLEYYFILLDDVQSTAEAEYYESTDTGLKIDVREGLTIISGFSNEHKPKDEMFKILAENARDVIYRVQLYPEPKFEYISPAVSKITGYSQEEMYINPGMIKNLIYSDDQLLLQNILNGHTDFTQTNILRWLAKDGKLVWTEQTNVPVYDNRGRLVAIEGIARDITERKLMEEQLRFLSLHDPLTGLHNRAYFMEEMRRFDSGRFDPVGILVCDVDGLKMINDTMGHHTGDQLLASAASVIKECFRDSDVVARIGGDEFAVLLPNSPTSVVEKGCHRIKEKVAVCNGFNPQVPLSISVGHAVKTGCNMYMNELFKEADNRMYQQKIHNKKSFLRFMVNNILKNADVTEFFSEESNL